MIPDQPNDYIDVTHGEFIVWEGGVAVGKSRLCLFSRYRCGSRSNASTGNFDTGVSFTAHINSDASDVDVGAVAGWGTNTYK